jgi:hypothetical protein
VSCPDCVVGGIARLCRNGVDSAYVPNGYQKVFGDEFPTANLDTTKWWTRYIYANGTLDYLNDEWQRYRENDNHVIMNNRLHLTPRLPGDGSIESGMVRSKMTVNGGYFEAKTRLPPRSVAGPWLNSDSAPDGSISWPPEIDIMENVINAPDVNSCCEHPNMTHTNGATHGPRSDAVLLADPNFNIEWNYWLASYNFYDELHVWGPVVGHFHPYDHDMHRRRPDRETAILLEIRQQQASAECSRSPEPRYRR